MKPTYEVHWTWVSGDGKGVLCIDTAKELKKKLACMVRLNHIYKTPRIYKVTRERVRVG